MRLPKFGYVEPADIDEASRILIDQPAAKVLAGGTDLLINMKHRVETPLTLVNLKRVSGLDYIRQDNGDLRIGALTPLKKLYHDPFIAEKMPALARAASSVGSYHHQTMGTIGGNICQQNRCKYFNQSKWWRSSRPLCFKAGGEICHVVNKNDECYSTYCGDLAPALMVMNSGVVLKGASGSRQVPLESIFSGDGKRPLNLEEGEILTEIVIPAEGGGGFSTYLKFANRQSIDFPIVGIAFWRPADGKESRLALTAVDRQPVRATKIEEHIRDHGLGPAAIEAVDDLISQEARPVKNSVFSPAYKRRLMGILIKSALREAIGR